AFAPTGQASLAVTTTSARVALGSADPTALITNMGSATAYLAFGGSGVTATTSGYPLQAGWAVAFNVGANTNVAATTAGGATSLSTTTGTGLRAIGVTMSGGGGGGAPSSSLGAALPATGTAAGFSDGANMQLARVSSAALADAASPPAANVLLNADFPLMF